MPPFWGIVTPGYPHFYLFLSKSFSRSIGFPERYRAAGSRLLFKNHFCAKVDHFKIIILAFRTYPEPIPKRRFSLTVEPIEIQLSLNSKEELFAEPDANPFDPDSRYLSGIDELVGQMRLKPRDLDKKSRLIIHLPQMVRNPDTKSTLTDALKRYCAAKILENQQVIKELRSSNRQIVISALVIVVLVLLLTILLVSLIPGLQAVSGAIAGFVGIAVWVIIWEPIYNYTYAWRPNKLDIRVYENLREADLMIAEV